MAAAAVAPSSSFASPHSSPTRDLLVPEMHLASLQDLQLNDYSTQQPALQPALPSTSMATASSPYVNGVTPPALADGSQTLAEPSYTPNGTPHTPVSAASSFQQKYNGLPPGAAPPAPGGSSGTLYPTASPSPPPAQPLPQPPQQRRISSSEPLVASPIPVSPQSGGGLPTPPPSHQQGSGSGPRHPSAAQAAAQSALPGAPRPRAAYAPAPTYPSIVTPMSLQGLIASESPAQQTPPAVTPPTNTQVAAAAIVRKKPDEEVCIECMMRDRDMADVDVTSPGVWTRPSDADWEDLLRREREEEMAERGTVSTRASASTSSHSSRPRVRSRGGKLSEENVRKWILMNPKDHEARWRTITKYVKAQSLLLEQEFAARARNEAESRTHDARARDRYAQLRRSTGADPSYVEPATGVRGVRVASTPTPSSLAQPTASQGYFGPQPDGAVPDAVETQSIPASPGRLLARAASQAAERDVVLLENGLMLERVDLRRERSGRARSVSLDKRSTQADDRVSVYSTPVPRYAVPSEGVPGGRTSRAIPRAQSQMSTDRRSLFSGLRSSLAGSMVSLSASRASVVNMHGQHFDRETLPGRAISPSMPTLNDLQHAEWPGLENLPAPPTIPASVGSEAGGKRKKRGALGKLFKLFGNSHSKNRPSTDSTAQPQHTSVTAPSDDLSAPLAPPPPLTYLMSRKSGDNAHQRQQSTTSLAGTGPSPPTAPSSILPSPTSNRFSWRASSASLDVVPTHQYVDFPAHLQQKHLDTLLEANGNGFDEDMTRRPVMRARMDTGASSARPHTVFLTDKSLPPLPPEAYGAQQAQLRPPRPATAPGVRERERRQSFAGMPTGAQPGQHGRSATEFGEEGGGGKRRSKFGLATLLGGKRKSSQQLRRDMSTVVQDEQFVAYRYLAPNDDPLAPAQRR